MRALRRPLAPEEASRLLELVVQPGAYRNLAPSEQYLFFNELLETLRTAGGVEGTALADVCIRTLQDPSRMETERDYAAQFLGQVYERGTLPPESLDAVFEAAESEPQALAATAFRTLGRIAVRELPLDRERLRRLTIGVVRNPGGKTDALYAAALQICVTLSIAEALPSIRQRALDPAGAPNIQLVALYALGELGDARDLEALDHLELKDSRATQALSKAREKLAIRYHEQTR